MIDLPSEPRGRVLPPSWHAAIYDAWRAGHTQREIARTLRIGRTTVERSLEYSRMKPWTPEEIEAVRALFGTASTPEIAARLGRTRLSVRHCIARLDLRVPQERGSCRPWTQDELRTLRHLAGTVAPQDIASLLGRTVRGVKDKARRISVSLTLPVHPSTLHSAAIVEEVRQAYAAGVEPAELRRRYPHINPWTLRAYIYDWRRVR